MSVLEIVGMWAVVMVVFVGLGRRLAKARRYRDEESRPGYIEVQRVNPNKNGSPEYYTYEMRRTNRQR